MATDAEVAQWMIDKIQQTGSIAQVRVVAEIEREFGADFVYAHQNGNQAISKSVLREFRKLRGGSIRWEREERAWYVHDEKADETADEQAVTPDEAPEA